MTKITAMIRSPFPFSLFEAYIFYIIFLFYHLSFIHRSISSDTCLLDRLISWIFFSFPLFTSESSQDLLHPYVEISCLKKAVQFSSDFISILYIYICLDCQVQTCRTSPLNPPWTPPPPHHHWYAARVAPVPCASTSSGGAAGAVPLHSASLVKGRHASILSVWFTAHSRLPGCLRR